MRRLLSRLKNWIVGLFTPEPYTLSLLTPDLYAAHAYGQTQCNSVGAPPLLVDLSSVTVFQEEKEELQRLRLNLEVKSFIAGSKGRWRIAENGDIISASSIPLILQEPDDQVVTEAP